MNISRRWLEAFLRRELDSKELVEKLAMLGAPVDVVEPLHAELAPFVVGRVLEVGPHPDPKATKVRLTRVDDGSGAPLTVVCGAPNVTAGKSYPFARLGTQMPGPGGFRIEPRPIRGVVSQGMLCSARELGLGQEHDGILELATDAEPGTPLLDVLPLSDERLVVDVTPNRPDLLCHKGVARELAFAYGIPFRLPAIPGGASADVPPPRRAAGVASVGGVEVRVEDPEGCPRFLGAVIRGVAIGPSPDWLRRRLEAAGVRSINNVVDATNYVMLELNQPMHAYDVGKVRGAALVARRGRVGETLVTLDGATRTVDPEMVVIADAERVVGIAGVMGGAETEVSDATRDIFLECASFTPSRVRRARRQLGLSSEASYRFERGVDRWGAPDALRRCIEVVLATAGGTLAEAPVDCWPVPSHPPRIFLRLARAAQVLGVELPLHLIEQYLVAIGATVVAKPEDGRLAVDVPGWRPDLVAEIDLIEEIARLHGFDNFPTELRPFRVGNLPDDPAHLAAQRVREGLVAMGLLEASTLPFGPAETGAAVAVLNPLSAEDAYLRQRLLPGLAREAERNWAAKTRDLRLFEIGTAFAAGAPGERPRETLRVAAVLSGARAPEHWAGPTAHDADLWEVKELAARVAALASPTATLHVGAMDFEFRSADGGTVGWAGSVEADAPPWAAPLFGLEVDIDITPRPAPRYRALPTTPAAERAVALLVPQGMQVAEVEAVIRHAGAPLLESVEVQSDYRGADLPAGTRSVAFRLVFRAPDRTLDSADVGQVEGDILSALDRAGVRRRGA